MLAIRGSVWVRAAASVPSAVMSIVGTAGEQVPTPQTHGGYEWFYVLSGHVRLVLGDQDLLLRPGEAAEFDTRVPHWIANAQNDQPAELLMLFGAQGERTHLSVTAT
jgi:quercetin dioxygenase-like cupin family protein